MHYFLPSPLLQRTDVSNSPKLSLLLPSVPITKRIFSYAIILILLLSSLFTRSQETLLGLTSNGGLQGKGTAFSIKTNGTAFAIMKEFADWGKNPNGSLVQGNDGFYYGMTLGGGSFNNYGTIFKISSTGAITILRQLNFSTDGAYPYGALTLGNDGHFYGLTSAGGTASYGTIFKITTTGVFTVVRTFASATDGGNPQGTMVRASDGNMYGITRRGGSTGYGTIFKFNPSTSAYSVIKTLNGTTDGGYCYGSVTLGKDGNIYGITYQGGSFTYGTIFKCSTTGTYTVLRNLKSTTDGGSPRWNSLVQHSDGFLYGMLYLGGTNGVGTIFKISTAGAFTVLRNLAFHPDGGYPFGSLIVGSDLNLYGATSSGGLYNGGTIFKMSTAGTFTRLKDLTLATDGGAPKGNLFRGSDGNYWGMTSDGGSNLGGTIFKISSAGTFAVVTRFNGGITGSNPQENLMQAKNFSYYGTTYTGGTTDYGTVFQICAGVYKVIYNFSKSPAANRPKGSIIEASDGNFYGMSSVGGTTTDGVIFKITPTGVYSILHTFVGATEGRFPEGSLIQGTDGYLYGTTSTGGSGGGAAGTIFKISTAGTFKVIRQLVSTTDGANPVGNLVKGPDSLFYGLTRTSNRIFKVSPNGTIFSIIKTLNGTTDGSAPTGSLVLGKDGNFYGMCSQGGGGTYRGTIFKVTPAGVLTILRRLTPATDGAFPFGSLVQAADGNFYGMTSEGGTYNSGTVFKITSTGVFTVLRHLNLILDGGKPLGSLIVQKTTTLVANPQTLTTSEDTAKAIVLTGTGGSPLTFNIVISPRHGTVTGTGANRSYKPNPNFNGKDSFYFTANVACQASPPAKVLITVNQVNDAPVLDSIRKKSVKVNTLLTFTATAKDADAGQTRTFSLITPPAGATIVGSTGVFKWTPTATGTYSFKVRVTDNGSPVKFDEELITVTVTAASSLPSTLDPNDLNQQRLSNRLNIYPNPMRDRFVVTLNESPQKISAIITDIRGVVVSRWTMRTINAGKLEFDMGRLSAGQYILKLNSPGKSWVFKLTKL